MLNLTHIEQQWFNSILLCGIHFLLEFTWGPEKMGWVPSGMFYSRDATHVWIPTEIEEVIWPGAELLRHPTSPPVHEAATIASVEDALRIRILSVYSLLPNYGWSCILDLALWSFMSEWLRRCPKAKENFQERGSKLLICIIYGTLWQPTHWRHVAFLLIL